MRKLRNIYYLRFGFKIRQGFAGGITSITPPLSPSPLSGSRGQEMRVRGKELSFYIWGEPAAPLPGGQAACRPSTGRQVPAARQGGGRLPPGPLQKKLYLFMYRSLPPPAGR